MGGSTVFPACAGVIRIDKNFDNFRASFPRMRGGDPIRPATVIISKRFSPHARG